MHPAVREAVTEAMLHLGNPSSVHTEGREARRMVEGARDAVAALIGAGRSDEIFFTSGGTESDNLAILGIARHYRDRGRHLITSRIEHHAVLHAFEHLERREGFEVTYLPVDREGFVDPEELREALREDTILVSIMLANNEVGTIEPVRRLAEVARGRGALFHTDAVQAVGQIPVSVQELDVDLLSLSSHKIYGPAAVGALYLRKGLRIESLLHGGAQERRVRPGSENLPGIVGFGKAAELAREELSERAAHLTRLRDRLITGVLAEIPDVEVNGPREDRLPGNANFLFRGVPGEELLLHLDMKGIAASSGSACTAGSIDPSHVLLAMGRTKREAESSLRLTLGRDNTADEIDRTVAVLKQAVALMRDLPAASRP